MDGVRRRGLSTLLVVGCMLLAAAPSASAQGVDTTCPFSLTRFDTTTTNVLALDTSAVYWTGTYVPIPGTRIRIQGQFPHARYTSFNTYNTIGRPIDSIADVQIKPDAGSTNPFLPGANRQATKRDYTVFIEFGAKPPRPKPNTIYAGTSEDGSPSPAGIFWYRVYVPDAGGDRKGNVPLPRVTLETADGKPTPQRTNACREVNSPYLDTVEKLIAENEGTPDLTGSATSFPGRSPPNWRLFRNLAQATSFLLTDSASTERFADAASQIGAGNNAPGFFSNRDIAYVFTGTSQGFGKVLSLRGRAPTFPDTRGSAAARGGVARMPAGKQLRYFSFCQYEPTTQRNIDCRNDDRVAVDSRGFYNVVVSTPANRPANARAECGVTWLPWGPFKQGLLIYRHMLAAPSFRQAIQRVGEPGRERAAMGDYYPEGRYFADKQAFEARGCL